MKMAPLLAGLASAGCEAPCEPYWKTMCASCKVDGCDTAKRRAETSLKEPGACEADARDVKALLEMPNGKQVACAMPAKGPLPSDALFGKWRCGSSALTIDTVAFKVGDTSFPVTQLTNDFSNLQMSPGVGMSCNLHLDGERLRIKCPTDLGVLGTDASCTR
jgi:hypothetical protein